MGSFNGAVARVRETALTLGQCLVHATSPGMFVGADAKRFRAVKGAARGAVFGEECYAYAMLARGFVELNPWGFCVLVPVVDASGGVMRGWNGERIGPHSDGRIIAACSERLLMLRLWMWASCCCGARGCRAIAACCRNLSAALRWELRRAGR